MKMKVDTSGITFLLIKDAERVKDYETGGAKADRNGVPLYRVQLVAMVPGDAAEVIAVKVPGEPEGLTTGGPVAVEGLTVQPWSMGDKHGVAFRAEAIRDGARNLASRSNGAASS